MASKTSRKKSPDAAKSETQLQADAAPQVDAGDDLAEVEAAIDEAQRTADAVGEEISQDAVDTVASEVEEAQAKAATESTDAGDGMDEIVSALEEVETAQQATGQPASLKEYDKAIASAVDDMLEGEFVSVDLVLEGMHETSPPPEPVKPKVDAADANAARDDVAADESEEAGDESADEAPVDEVTKDAESSEASALDGDFVAVEDTAVAPIAHDKVSPAVHADPAPAKKETSPASPPPARHAAPAKRPAPRVAIDDDAPAVVTASTPPGAIRLITDFARPAIRYGVVPLLELMSMPLKFVPPRTRDIVDWIALSLVFWVPIVWIFALFIVG